MTNTLVRSGAGDGPPLVLVHGVGLDHTMWDLIVPPLAADHRGPRSITTYDLLGHGDTEPLADELTMDRFIEQLLTVCNQAAGTTPGPNNHLAPDVAGLSLGGAIVRGAAARHPDRFGRVVIANAVFDRSEAQRRGNIERLTLAAQQGMEPVADLAVDRWFTQHWQETHPGQAAAVHRRIATTGLAGYLDAYRVFVDGDPAMPELLPSLINETLVVTGERDAGSTPAMAEAMAALLPNGTARVLPATGHLPPIESPETFVALLIDFLENPRL